MVDAGGINTAFTKYYENLYKAVYPDTSEKQNEFLNQLQLLTLTEEAKINLN